LQWRLFLFDSSCFVFSLLTKTNTISPPSLKHQGTPTFTAEVGLGWNDVIHQTPATPKDLIPAGSLTKSFTAAAVMRLVDRGTVQLDDPITEHTDDWLQRVNGTTLVELFGANIANTSVRTLLSMNSGMSDYRDSVVMAYGTADPLHDITPLEYLHNSTITPNKLTGWRCNATSLTTICPPPSYNSLGFLLLGLVLCQHANVSSWEHLDQLAAAVPAAARANGRYDSVKFFGKGPCSSYPNVVHYYNYQAGRGHGTPPQYMDQYNTSCLNGWAFGNIGATPLAAATFFYDLLGGGHPTIVSGDSVVEMMQWGGVLSGHTWEKCVAVVMLLCRRKSVWLEAGRRSTRVQLIAAREHPHSHLLGD
jgi:CubicO group peptidase (beta-lactamase class C family)